MKLPVIERHAHYRAWLGLDRSALDSKLDVPLPEVDKGKAITKIVDKHLSMLMQTRSRLRHRLICSQCGLEYNFSMLTPSTISHDSKRRYITEGDPEPRPALPEKMNSLVFR